MQLTIAGRNVASGQRLRSLIRRRGVTCKGEKLWTPAEDSIVRQLYPDYEALKKALPMRTMLSLRGRCRALKIQNKRHTWTGAEQTRFRKLYTTAPREALLAAFPSFSSVALQSRAAYHGLTRPQRKLKKTGHPLLDSLREFCSQQAITMVDLDEFAGSGQYFQKATWRWCKTVNYNRLVRAVNELGGRLEITWPD